jgi:hypothetical protein
VSPIESRAKTVQGEFTGEMLHVSSPLGMSLARRHDWRRAWLRNRAHQHSRVNRAVSCAFATRLHRADGLVN